MSCGHCVRFVRKRCLMEQIIWYACNAYADLSRISERETPANLRALGRQGRQGHWASRPLHAPWIVRESRKVRAYKKKMTGME